MVSLNPDIVGILEANDSLFEVPNSLLDISVFLLRKIFDNHDEGLLLFPKDREGEEEGREAEDNW